MTEYKPLTVDNLPIQAYIPVRSAVMWIDAELRPLIAEYEGSPDLCLDSYADGLRVALHKVFEAFPVFFKEERES